MKKTIVREYRLQSPYIKEKQELTLAFLTDLHDQVTGEDGERIFQLLEKQHPDLVLVGGDVVVGKKGCETEKAFGFLKKLSAIATSSTGKIPFFPPASIAMFAMVKRSSMDKY